MIERAAPPTQRAFAQALLDPTRPAPPGLLAWNGSDVGVRFGVYRNNVVTSLVGVLADTFPVVRRLVGDEFFAAMARLFICDHPPGSPVMSEYGDAFPVWVADFEPATALPYLAAMARLELARVRAFHAADATALPAQALADAVARPERLATLRLRLHPSLAVLDAAHAVVSLWAAHQSDDAEAISRVALDAAEAALVLRHGEDVLVLPLAGADAALARALQAGTPLAEAAAQAPQADLSALLALLLRHEAVVGLDAETAADAPTHDPASAPAGAATTTQGAPCLLATGASTGA